MKTRMHLRAVFLLSLPLLSLWLAGCGAGSGGGSAADGDRPFQYGPLSGRAAATNPPVVSNGWGASVVGLTGQINALELYSATPFLQTSKIAFYSNRDGNYEIYTMNADGSGVTRLTNNAADDYDPSWSPDGVKIAFASTRDGNSEIYTMYSNGSAQTNLTNNSAGDYSPSWSPDGVKIAFVSNRDGNWEIYTMNADGSAQTNLTNNSAGDYSPSWSPDGSKIAFISNRDGNWEIYTMNADGSAQTNLTNNSANDYSPSWSPDGSKIAFYSNRDGNYEIYTMNADGSAQTNLSSNGASDNAPAFSPEGSKIVFTSSRDGNDEIYTMNADGSGQTRITNHSAFDEDPNWQPVRRRRLLGAGGLMGSSAHGFIFAHSGEEARSIVTFSAATSFDTLLLSALTPTNASGPNLLYVVEGATTAVTLTSLRYWNLNEYRPVVLALSTGTALNGALVSFSSGTGRVALVLPYTAPNRSVGGSVRPSVQEEGGVRLLRGSFVGVFDARGQNLAPGGASEVRLDVRTGALLSVR